MRYAVLLVVVLAGCSTNPSRNWVKAGASGEQMEADRYACIRDMGSARPIDADAQFDACMRSKGWRPS